MALKNKTKISTTLPNDLLEELREYSEISMIPMSRLIETALKSYLSQVKERNSSPT